MSLPATIFLGEQRSVMNNAYCTFKKPFGNLYLFNEEVLAADSEKTFIITEPAYVILIPVTGELLYQGMNDLDVGQVLISKKAAGENFCVKNRYEEDVIQFMHIQIKAPAGENFTSTARFGLGEFQNNFFDITQSVAENIPFRISMVQLGGRKKAVYKAADLRSLLFSFVLSGAFEIEDRLLHPKDGLALWKIGEVEMEALSNEALVLVIEMEG